MTALDRTLHLFHQMEDLQGLKWIARRWRSVHNRLYLRRYSGVLRLLCVRQVLQRVQIEGHEEPFCRDIYIGLAASRRPWSGPDQAARTRAPNQVSADVFAKDVLYVSPAGPGRSPYPQRQ